MGSHYIDGKGVKKNFKKAIYWFQKAAKHGDAKAQYNLGVLYEKGDGVSKNLRKAVKWYLKAAEQAHQEAQANRALYPEVVVVKLMQASL